MVKILDSSEYKSFYDLKIKNIPHNPFHTYSWAVFHEKYFKDKFYFLSLEENNNFKAGLALFEVSTPTGKWYYSFGRFGVSGFIFNLNHDCKTEEIYEIINDVFENILKKINPDPISISLGSIQLGYYSEEEVEAFKQFCDNNNGKYFTRFNHIANINLLTDDERNLSFRDYNRRSNLSRNLKKAKSEGLHVSDQIDSDIINKWHKIHLERVAELGGKHWDLSFFLRSWEADTDKYLKFFGVYKERVLAGGVYCFYNKNVLDLFMMSTLREYQQIGANHLLSEYVYQWCINNDIKYINWQGSNPPEGGTAKFKEQWMAQRYVMHAVNLVCDQVKFDRINRENLMQEYPDRFFYPFN